MAANSLRTHGRTTGLGPDHRGANQRSANQRSANQRGAIRRVVEGTARRAPSRDALGRARSGMVARCEPAIMPDDVQPMHETELSRTYRALGISLAERVVSIEMGIGIDALHARTRCTAEVAFARQVAMYLANTIFSISQSEVGHRFGRDRTTVKHACARVEDRRDDAAFEARLVAMEAVLEEARRAMQIFAVQADTVTERILIEIGARPNGLEDRR